MAHAPKLYTRLTRNASGVGTHSSLWLGPDHLMIATSSGYTESYARLQFRDVQGFFVTPSDRRFAWRISWAIPAISCAIVAGVSLLSHETPRVSGIIFALTLIGLVWNELLGPSCHAFVVTGVQTARLPSLVRRKKTRSVLGRLQPLIEAAQADLAVAPAASPAEAAVTPAAPPALPAAVNPPPLA